MKTENTKYVERFEQLIRVLQNLPPHEKKKHFDMGEWGVETECGTVACAAGHCGLDPWFMQQGFALSDTVDGEIRTIEFEVWEGWTALHVFFGFEIDEGYGDFGDATPESALIFRNPHTIPQVIKAAKARIKQLQAA